jgi:hypothetical protein
LQHGCVFLYIFTTLVFHVSMNIPAIYRIFSAVLVLLVLLSCERQEPDTKTLEEKLNDLPGVTAFPVEPVYGYMKQFRLEIEQPVDHTNPGGATFTQEAHLHHAGEDLPVVFGPAGYGTSERSGQELARLMESNMLIVTHRYFVDAEPVPMDWKYLTIEQAAADHHRVVKMFKEIYGGAWVSSGASKSGQTALFHRRFYPEDVDATVAYVAPIVFGTSDERFVPFMENIGSPDCRAAQNNYERMLLEKRDTLLPMFVNWFTENGFSLSLDQDEAFEYAILEYHFAFWQFHRVPCDSLPVEGASVEELFKHLVDVVWMDLFSDSRLNYYAPYHYQALTQNGYPSYVTGHIADLLEFADDPGAHFFFPMEVPTIYDPSVIRDIDHWLRTEGDNIVYIYGEIDPWTAALLEPGEHTNAFHIVQTGGDHGVRIDNLDERSRVIDSLEAWLEVEME